MKIPSKIRIKPKVFYEILFVDEFHNDPNTVGECRFEKRQIVLKSKQSKTDLIKTAIHEILHALEFEHGIKIPHASIYILEQAIFKVLKLNGWIK